MTIAFRIAAAFAVLALTPFRLLGQDDGAPLRLQAIAPGGVRTSVTESWGTYVFTVSNPNSEGRDARVVVIYPSQPDVHCGRDIWVPGKSNVSSWVTVGPPPLQPHTTFREIQFLLYDRTGGQDRLLLPPGDDRVRTHRVPFERRKPTTAVFVDPFPSSGDPNEVTKPGERAARAILLVRAMRLGAGLSEEVLIVQGGKLPNASEALMGLDHVVLAGRSLANDPPGRDALRSWVQQGGKLWIMLDLVGPGDVAAILGDGVDFHVLDEVGLTSLRLKRADDAASPSSRDVDEPVELTRVIPGSSDRVIHTVDGWPASFTRSVGRGKVLFTSLSSGGWARPRTERDLRSPITIFPDLPIALPQLAELMLELRPPTATPLFTLDDLKPLLAEEIGYSVIDLRTVAAALGLFVLSLMAMGFALRRSRRPEFVGLIGPAAALLVAALLVALGEGTRGSVPPTAAIAELVDVSPGNRLAAANGLFAIYHPASGPLPLSADRGGLLNLDTSGLEGQTRRRIQTDTHAWHFDGLSLPAGVRFGPAHHTVEVGDVRAIARFGPNGLEGRLTTGSYINPVDALLLTPAREPISANLGTDGSFTASPADLLPQGRYVAGSLLSDRQQRRQEVYRRLLSGTMPEHLEGRNLLLTWAESPRVPFTGKESSREIRTAMLIIPLEFERTAPATRVTIPPAFVPYQRASTLARSSLTTESSYPTSMRLRFQIPPSVLPLIVERATFVARVRAPGWRFEIAGNKAGQTVPLRQIDDPIEPVQIEITDPNLLQLDSSGGLFFEFGVATRPGATAAADMPKWKIESLSLGITGRTAER